MCYEYDMATNTCTYAIFIVGQRTCHSLVNTGMAIFQFAASALAKFKRREYNSGPPTCTAGAVRRCLEITNYP